MNRRSFLRTAGFSAGAALFAPRFATAHAPALTPLFIDADTANEIDDLYAIVRALLEPSFDIVALSSAQWNHRLSPRETVAPSRDINEDLIELFGRYDIPMPLGAWLAPSWPRKPPCRRRRRTSSATSRSTRPSTSMVC